MKIATGKLLLNPGYYFIVFFSRRLHEPVLVSFRFIEKR